MTEVLILAAIALFVLSRLYVALGRDDGSPDARPAPGQRPRPVPASNTDVAEKTIKTRDETPHFTGPAAGGLEEIYNADETFRPREFLLGARSAYEMIVAAFADGQRETLRPLLDDDVYEAWDEAITARETSGDEPWRVLRLKGADIEDASLTGQRARVMVRFEAELGNGEKTRMAREVWTFMRDVNSPDPNWLLDDVEAAN